MHIYTPNTSKISIFTVVSGKHMDFPLKREVFINELVSFGQRGYHRRFYAADQWLNTGFIYYMSQLHACGVLLLEIPCSEIACRTLRRQEKPPGFHCAVCLHCPLQDEEYLMIEDGSLWPQKPVLQPRSTALCSTFYTWRESRLAVYTN